MTDTPVPPPNPQPPDAFAPPPPAPAPPPAPTPPAGSGALDLSQPQRQSPLAAVFMVIKAVRAIGIVQLVLGIGFVFSQSGSVVFIAIGAAIIAVILLVIALLSWWRYTFRVEEGELRVQSGVLSNNRLTLPLDRVQSVSIEQKFLHRIVGLVEVTADTAGTAGAEFNLAAVTRPVAEALQAAAADHRSSVAAARQAQTSEATGMAEDGSGAGLAGLPPTDAPERVLIRRTPRELVRIAFTTIPIYGLAVIAPLLAVAGETAEYIPFDLPEISVEPGRWLFWFVPMAVLAVIVCGFLLNTATLLLREWEMTLTQTSAGLRRNAGLLSKRSTASSIPRIQAFKQSQNILERRAGISSIRLVGVSAALDVGSGSVNGTIAIDGCTQDETDELRRIVFDGSEPIPSLDRTVSQLEVFKQTRNFTIFVVLLIAGLFWSPIGAWSFVALLAIPLWWAAVKRWIRLRRWGLNHAAIASREAFVGYRSTETLLRKTNSAVIRQSLFERKRDLATVTLKLANGEVTIGMIPIHEARAVRDRALFVAETDKRSFM